MKKVIDQTLRDIKREVNKKVLKVPGIEQKVLDSTSNEPWGPHGSLLADIAQASRNYHEYQMVMSVLWKRINDTGKNWRHVYKALIVLEYLVGHGSERVIDDIREHAYQISTLSEFQYIDSSGRDQGNNVRRKSQALVLLVNDKERILEVRQKAAANQDKYRNTPSGGMYRPSSHGDRYDDERYGSRDDDRNGYGYGRDRDYNYKDDDRYGKYSDSSSRGGDRYGMDYEERYSRDGYRDDDHQGRSRTIDGDGPRSRSVDGDRDRPFDDDAQSSSRDSGARADDQFPDGRRFERKYSEQNIGAPPSYEDALCESRSPAHSERNGETSVNSAPGSSPPAPGASPPAPSAGAPPAPNATAPPAPNTASPSASNKAGQTVSAFGSSASPAGQEVEVVDEFDPRGAVSASPIATAAPTSFNSSETDLLGSLSDSFTPNPLAIMPVTSAAADSQANFPVSIFDEGQSASDVTNQSFEDPFGDAPFKAVPSTETVSAQQPMTAPVLSFQPTVNQYPEMPHAVSPTSDPVNDYDFGSTFPGITYSATNIRPPSTNSPFYPQEISTLHQETDILADILPPSGSFSVAPDVGFAAPSGQHALQGVGIYGNISSQRGAAAHPIAFNTDSQSPQPSIGNFQPQTGSTGPMLSHLPLQTQSGPASQFNNEHFYTHQGSDASGFMRSASPSGPAPELNDNFLSHQGLTTAAASHVTYQTPAGPVAQQNNDVFGNLFSPGPNASKAFQPGLPATSGSLDIVPRLSKDKFETKSTVWADTLSRGLVNLNISGPKINPLSDIGIDFDAINRKEKRMEKPTTAAVTSTVTMGKAMGSGSGIGRTGASALSAPSNPTMGSGMGMGGGMNLGMGMGGGTASGIGMGSYGSMNQPVGMGMGMGMRMNMGINMGMGQGGQVPLGGTMPGGYNPMRGRGGYPQQPYGGGYR